MIKYNIDRNELILMDDPQDAVVLLVQGWAYSDTDTELDFTVDIDAPYRVKLYSREDVDALFANEKRNKFSGFTIEIILYKKIKDLTFYIYEKNHKEKIIIPIDILRYYKRQWMRNRAENKKNKQAGIKRTRDNAKKIGLFIMGSVEGKIFYNLDELLYINALHEVILRGWQLSYNDKNVIEFCDSDILSQSKSDRPDVIRAFDLSENTDKNGFEYHIAVKNPEQFCFTINNDSEGVLKVCLPIDSFNGGKFDARNILSSEQTEDYLKKYGKEGIVFKKKEREIFFQEAIMNSRPYIFESSKNVSDVKNCDLSLIIAVNSEKYLQELNIWLNHTKYKMIQVILVGAKQILNKWKIIGNQVKMVECESKNKEELIQKAFSSAEKELVMFMDQEDVVDDGFFAYISENIQGYDYIYSDYDIMYENKSIIRVNRIDDFLDKENEKLVFTACAFRRKYIEGADSCSQVLERIKKNGKGLHNNNIMFHYNAVVDNWNDEPTKAIAFYLTQYHITEENNKWWGEGFTEWKNVTRAYPMFEGHDQPRIPTDMGYYDLVEDKTIQYKQIDLAKKYGIYGFCYYYYWFEGKRLLRKPLDQFVENHELELPYCICWANETWSKRWDGLEHEILMQQVHNEQTDRDFIYDIIPMFKDERYIRIEDKPLLLVYRFDLFPAPNQTIELWRKICRDEGIGEIHIAIVQSFDAIDHRLYGADSSVEFPPHKISAIPNIRIDDKMNNKNPNFGGHIYSYKRIVENLSTIEKRDYTLFPGSMLKWDNTARKLEMADVFHEFSPELYRQWLIKNHHYTRLYNKDNVMFINAWNEWAEGSYLEPDETYGLKLLEITKEVTNFK